MKLCEPCRTKAKASIKFKTISKKELEKNPSCVNCKKPARFEYTGVSENFPEQFQELDVRPVTSKLSIDIKVASKVMSNEEARYLVSLFYQMQDYRITSENQTRSLVKEREPFETIAWFASQSRHLEESIGKVLDFYSTSSEIGRWCRSILGIGPILTAGLLAHIDPDKAITAGDIWRYAGLDPTLEWLGEARSIALVDKVLGKAKVATEEHLAAIALEVNRNVQNLKQLVMSSREFKLRLKREKELGLDFVDEQSEEDTIELNKPITRAELVKVLSRRPFNGALKVLCYKIGDSFTKVQNNPNDIYGKIYAARKVLEQQRNEAGAFAGQAATKLERCKIGKDKVAYEWYSKGKLPPDHVNSRARRYAVKLFLSHFQHVLYESTHGKKPPAPYVIAHKGHIDYIPPPNWPMSA